MSKAQQATAKLSRDALSAAIERPSVFASNAGIGVAEAVSALRDEIAFRKRNPKLRRS